MEIESGPANQDWHPAGPSRRLDLARGHCQPGRDRGPFGAIENAIEAMGGPCLFTVIGARRQHPQIAIKLHRVGIDDDAATALRKRERQPGLARGRRPADHQDGTVGEGVI